MFTKRYGRLSHSLPNPDLEEKKIGLIIIYVVCPPPPKQRKLNNVYKSHLACQVHYLEKWTSQVGVLVTYTSTPLNNFHLSLSYSHILRLIPVYHA